MILIVDDNSQVRQLIRLLLEDLDGEFCECEDGVQAFAAFVEYHPDWVLMDLAMPGMNGLAATRQIIAAFPEARIAIVTSYDDAKLRRAAVEAGACEYIVKDNLTALRQLLAQFEIKKSPCSCTRPERTNT